MIEALLRDCRDVDGVGRLFDALGYPVNVCRVDRQVLDQLRPGLEYPLIHHLSRGGGIDLYAAETRSEVERERLRELLNGLAARNHVIRPVIAEIHGGDEPCLSLHGGSVHRRRRLDVDLLSPSRDAVDRICGLMIRGRDADEVDPGTLFDRAFDRELLEKRFLERFRKSVNLVERELSGRCQNEVPSDCRDQALLLLSRLLFVHLIQRKGWLDGDRRFLRERLEECIRQGSRFHASVVRPLFFDCLNRPKRSRPAVARRLGRIPYLNGGLFEPSAFERKHPDIELPNDVWREILDSTFEPFSMSVSELDDDGAHVDPEMLGKVFEKLMESEERARTGSYYTPREVVDTLTRSAIVRWCAEEDAAVIASLSSVLSGGEAEIDATRAARLLRRLETITVLDPACGSGAFLLSALRTIERLTVALAEAAGEARSPDLRADIAARSLFGVDLKPEAVRLCELRIWLAIVSGSELDVDSVPPLPNLDRNVLQGNSLVDALDFLSGERTGIYRDWVLGLRERERLLEEYRRSSSARRRRLAARLRESDRFIARGLLQRSIDIGEAELRALDVSDRGLFDGAPMLSGKEKREAGKRIRSRRELMLRLDREEVSFFSFDLHFATVQARGGFAVVLGNPPWVRGSNVEEELRRLLADRYRSFGAKGSKGFRQAELAMAFVERSLALLAPDGVLAQLVPSKVTSADYAREVRLLLETETSILELHDWSTRGRSLFGADVFPLGIVAAKVESDEPVAFHSSEETYRIERGGLRISMPGSAWSTTPPDVARIVRRIMERSGPLSEVLGRRPVMGVKTGANASFFVDEVELLGSMAYLPGLRLTLPAAALVRAVRGRDVTRWRATHSTWMLWPAGLNGDRKVARLLSERLGMTPDALRLSYVKSEHLGLKVAWKDVSRGLSAAVLPDRTEIDGVWFSVVPNQTLYSIDVATGDEGHALAALLNSTVANALALQTAERAKDDHWRFLANVVGAIALPAMHPSSADWRALVKIGRRAAAGEKVRNELDRLVARLYGIDENELRRLERFVASTLGMTR